MKRERQKALLELIARLNIYTQEELTSRLNKAGFETTQATVSRDMKELGIEKSPNGYVHVGIPMDYNKKYIKILSECVVSVDHAMNLVVVKTYSGMGAAAGAAIDALEMNEIVGSIAGDDTVLLVTKSEEKAVNLYERFKDEHIN